MHALRGKSSPWSSVLPQAVLHESFCGSSGFSVAAAGGLAPYMWTWKRQMALHFRLV